MEKQKFTPADIVAEAKSAARRSFDGECLIMMAEISPMIKLLEGEDYNIFARVFLDQITHLQREAWRKHESKI